MKILTAEIFNRNRLIDTKEIEIDEKSTSLETTLYNFNRKKIFVFITKKIYNSLNKEITQEIDNISFPESIENSPITLEDILNKKVLFVKYNLEYEIKEIIKLRENINNDSFYIIIRELK
jgi:hypothetical protein